MVLYHTAAIMTACGINVFRAFLMPHIIRSSSSECLRQLTPILQYAGELVRTILTRLEGWSE